MSEGEGAAYRETTEPCGEEQMTPRQSQALPSASVQSASAECGSSITARLKASSADAAANKSSQTCHVREKKMANLHEFEARRSENAGVKVRKNNRILGTNFAERKRIKTEDTRTKFRTAV